MESKFVILILKMISADITGNELKTFCILLKHMDSKNECYPSIRTIAKSYNMSPTTVSKCLMSLEEKNIIISQKRTVNGKNTSNLYRINPEFLVEKKSKRKRIIEMLPDWFDKEFNVKKPSKEKLKEMEDLMEEFKDGWFMY